MLLPIWAAILLLQQCGDPPSRASLAYWDYLQRCGCAGVDPPSRASNDYERFMAICTVPPTAPPPPAPSPTPFSRLWPQGTRDIPMPAASATPTPKGVALREAPVQVVRVHDGDTLDVLLDGRLTKLRLYGVDAPELNQPFGKEARLALLDLLRGRAVDVQISRTDEHGRQIARVVAGGVDVGTTLVQHGSAWWYQEYAPKDGTLAAAEEAARARHIGLWSGTGAIAPWD